MQAATEKIRDVPAGAECHVAQFGYDEAQIVRLLSDKAKAEAEAKAAAEKKEA